MIRIITYSVLMLTIGLLYGEARSREQPGHLYPICSEVAHVTQEAWQDGQINESEARGIIERCLAWEDGR